MIQEVAGIICMGKCVPDVMKREGDTLSTNWPKTTFVLRKTAIGVYL